MYETAWIQLGYCFVIFINIEVFNNDVNNLYGRISGNPLKSLQNVAHLHNIINLHCCTRQLFFSSDFCIYLGDVIMSLICYDIAYGIAVTEAETESRV